MAYKIMVQGTASDVGKSIIATAICRHFYKRGLRVAPFKAQNMALNSYVTAGGGEIGRSQAVQAMAAGAEPRVEMNPVLIKPKGDMSCQVIAMGRPAGDFSAAGYRIDYLPLARKIVADAVAVLDREYDIIVMEGAGSPVEVNLKVGDIVNMAAAKLAGSPVVLVADIDRGGVFASLVGTFALLEPEERQRVIGIIINKFRGDPKLFEDGVQFLEQRLGVPVLGVLPHLPELDIPAEDSLALTRTGQSAQSHQLTVGVIQLPLISNFTDLDPLAWAGVGVEMVTRPEQLIGAHAIIIPGSKNTVSDLRWMKEQGLDKAILANAQAGAWILGICGGYQILGLEINDPGSEDQAGCYSGLGLLPVKTTYNPEKTTRQIRGELLLEPLKGVGVEGYEIHHGISVTDSRPFVVLDSGEWDGSVSRNYRIIGTYLHGVLDNSDFCRWWLEQAAKSAGVNLPPVALDGRRRFMAALDRLEQAFTTHIDTEKLWDRIKTWQE
jgi:adenosylcobyric acid synthase